MKYSSLTLHHNRPFVSSGPRICLFQDQTWALSAVARGLRAKSLCIIAFENHLMKNLQELLIDVVFAFFSSKSWQAKWFNDHLKFCSWWYWIVVAWYHTQVWTWTVSIGHLYMSCPCQSGTQGHLIGTKVANNGNYVINRGSINASCAHFLIPFCRHLYDEANKQTDKNACWQIL